MVTEEDAIVVAQVTRRLINAGAVQQIRHVHGMSDVELELLAAHERHARRIEAA